MTLQMMEITSLTETWAWSEENVEEMVCYGTDAYGAQCGHIRAIPVICAQRNIPLSCIMQLQYTV